jgi:hypothetical protein
MNLFFKYFTCGKIEIRANRRIPKDNFVFCVYEQRLEHNYHVVYRLLYSGEIKTEYLEDEEEEMLKVGYEPLF